MSSSKRYIATFTMYIHEKNDKKAFIQARKIGKRIDTKFGGKFNLEKLEHQPFGTMQSDEVNINQLKMEI